MSWLKNVSNEKQDKYTEYKIIFCTVYTWKYEKN